MNAEAAGSPFRGDGSDVSTTGADQVARPVTMPGRRIQGTVIVVLVIGIAALLAGNLIFLTADEPAREAVNPIFSDLRFNGDNDGSYAEIFGYLLMLVNFVLLLVLWRLRGGIFGVLALIVIVILADDVLMLHERTGSRLVSRVDDFRIAGLGPQDVGEGLFWLTAAALLGALFVVAYVRSDAHQRRRTHAIVVLLALLAFFGVGVDFVHSALISRVSSFVITAITLLETFGELVSMVLSTHRADEDGSEGCRDIGREFVEGRSGTATEATGEIHSLIDDDTP